MALVHIRPDGTRCDAMNHTVATWSTRSMRTGSVASRSYLIGGKAVTKQEYEAMLREDGVLPK